MFENIKGFIAICKPDSKEVEKVEIEWSTDIEDKCREETFKKFVKYTTGKEDGAITNIGYLPSPLENITGFIDFDQFNPDTEYNFNFFGNPLFGNITFLGLVKDSEDGDIVPLDEEGFKIVNNFVSHMKEFEENAGIASHMKTIDKKEFLQEFINEQNSVISETVNAQQMEQENTGEPTIQE